VPALTPPAGAPQEGLRVGVLGGSFNPAHAGHLHISRLALERLRLDRVWWLVSPQNPLKSGAGMAPLEDRLAAAREAATDPRIRVTDLERDLGTRYTVDTLGALRQHFPGIRFVWIMGADLLVELPRWKRWHRLFRTVPIAVFARPTYSYRALFGRVARRFARARVSEASAARLATRPSPAWCFLHTPRHLASATRIRSRRGQAVTT
jgi:nicotinate-nucleotide adenylyltransferase